MDLFFNHPRRMAPSNYQPGVFFKEIEAQLGKRATGNAQKSDFEEMVPIHGISEHTVATHRKNILSKSNYSGTEQLKMFLRKLVFFKGRIQTFEK